MDKVLLYEEDSKLLARIMVELMKYEGQFELIVAHSLQQARELIYQKSITLSVVGVDLKNLQHVNFLSMISTQHTQVPFILMKMESSGDEVLGADKFNILQVINKPFELSLIANAIIDGLDAIDEGLLWRRLRSLDRS